MNNLPHVDCESKAPDDCPDCGKRWSHTECVHTGDPAGVDGWEDWCYCSACKCELFYPLLATAAA